MHVPFTKPSIPVEQVMGEIRGILTSGQLTNNEKVRMFEQESCRVLDVKEAVAVSSCTSGLMLVLKALRIKGTVIMPSFTFTATGLAALWNSLEIEFADVQDETLTLSPEHVNEIIDDKTAALIAVHTFGNPCAVTELQEIAEDNNLPLIFDAAHALGSEIAGKKVGGFGTAEIFSLSPTKLVTGGEGGLITTNDEKLARRLRRMRNYGIVPETYDCVEFGLNARMPEINAVLASHGLKELGNSIKKRNHLVDAYWSRLKKWKGIQTQKKTLHATHAYKDFYLSIDEETFGHSRDELYDALKMSGVECKKYFHPPLHFQKLFKKQLFNAHLEHTEKASKESLCLPLFNDLTEEQMGYVVAVIEKIAGGQGTSSF